MAPRARTCGVTSANLAIAIAVETGYVPAGRTHQAHNTCKLIIMKITNPPKYRRKTERHPAKQGTHKNLRVALLENCGVFFAQPDVMTTAAHSPCCKTAPLASHAQTRLHSQFAYRHRRSRRPHKRQHLCTAQVHCPITASVPPALLVTPSHPAPLVSQECSGLPSV